MVVVVLALSWFQLVNAPPVALYRTSYPVMAGPVFAGAVQVTARLVNEAALTVGASGASGGSSTSVTVTVIVCSDVIARSAVPPVPAAVRMSTIANHDAKTMKTLETEANARLHERSDRTTEEQEAMLQQAGHLQISCELGHAPQRLAAVRTSEPMLGVRSWTTANLKTD